MGLDWSKWTRNMTGYLGRRGEVFVIANECPRARTECEGCEAFMGHKKEAPAYAGDDVNFCCADKLK